MLSNKVENFIRILASQSEERSGIIKINPIHRPNEELTTCPIGTNPVVHFPGTAD